MFLSFLFYILIFNFNVIKSLQTDKLTVKSIYPSITTLETTTDYKKRLRKLIRKHALPLQYFTKKNLVTNVQAGKLKLPHHVLVTKSKGISTKIHLPYLTHIQNATVKQTRATAKSRISQYPTKITFIPRTITHTLHKNPYFEKNEFPIFKKTEFNENMNAIDKKVDNAKHVDLSKRSLPMVRETKPSTKGAVEKLIEEQLKFRRKLNDDVLLDVLSDHLIETDYAARSYKIRNISGTDHNFEAIFNTEIQNLSTYDYYVQPWNIRPTAELQLKENAEYLPKFEQRKSTRHWYSRKMAEIANLDLEQFKTPSDTTIPSETQFISNVDNLVKSRNPAEYYYEYRTETNHETVDQITDAGVRIVYNAIDKDLVTETESNLGPEIKLLSTETGDNVRYRASQIAPTRTSNIFPTRTSHVVPEYTETSKFHLWGLLYPTPKTQPPWRVNPPENPNPTTTPETPTRTSIVNHMETPINSKRKKKKKSKSRKTTVNSQQAYIKQWPKGTDLNRKDILVTNYKTIEEHTLNPTVNDMIKRLNYRTSTTVPKHMRRDWANWGYRRGKTGDPHIYLDLYNDFYDVNYVTK